MSTALARWRRHRVDYRGPAFAAVVLATLMIALLPRMWLLLDHRETQNGDLARSLAPYFAEDKSLQLIDPRLLSGAPDMATPSNAPAIAIPAPHERALDKEPPEAGKGESDFAWDPTRGYRLSEELVKPRESPSKGTRESIPLSFGSLMESRQFSAIAPQDSESVMATLNFARVQRQIFLKYAPLWSAEKATERARELYLRMLMSNPLRGPQ